MEYIISYLVILFRTLTYLLVNIAKVSYGKCLINIDYAIILSSSRLARVVIKQNSIILSGYVEETIEHMDVDLEEYELDEQLKCDITVITFQLFIQLTFFKVNRLNVFEFIEPDTYISMVSDDYCESFYVAKVIEKNVAKDEIHDRFGQLATQYLQDKVH